MLDLTHAVSGQYCDQVRRRDFLRLGGLALGGLTLSTAFRARAAASEGTATVSKVAKPWGKSAILIWLAGGPSHLETWDPKPTAPAEIRGPFGTIPTKTPGLFIGELFPQLAAISDKYSIIRSCCHEESGHGGGQRWVMTGYPSRSPEFELPHDYPNAGSVVARMKGPNRRGMPGFTAVPPSGLHDNSAAYLGAAHNPLEIYSNGRPTGMTFDKLIPTARMSERRSLRQALDTIRRDVDQSGMMAAMDDLEAQAFELVTGAVAQDALNAEKETATVRQRYGNSDLGKSCLLARRMVEAGTTFVSVTMGAWDQHGAAGGTINEKYREYGPIVDQAVSALLIDLDERGLLDHTVVYLLGEFGRTPRMNGTGGRDHWPQAMSILMTGGGLRRGQVVGATSPRGEYPVARTLGPADVLATIYHALEIDPRRVFANSEGRPVQLLDRGEPIRELI